MKRSRSFLRYRRGSRDANHKDIREGLEKLGHLVIDLAGVGDGVPDLAVLPHGAAPGCWRFVELKVGKGKQRESQLEWQARVAGRGVRVHVARTLDEALEALK